MKSKIFMSIYFKREEIFVTKAELVLSMWYDLKYIVEMLQLDNFRADISVGSIAINGTINIVSCNLQI